VGALHSKQPITEPTQFKGMKIRPANGTVAQMTTLLGATNVQVSAPESRDALEKGVADAITFPWKSIVTFGIDKAVKYHTDFRLYAANFVWAMNPGWYGKLSPAQKQVIDSHCTNEWAGKVGKDWGDDEDSGREILSKQAGHTIVSLSPQQMDAWKKAVAPIYDQWAAGADKAGHNGKQALEALRKELATRGGAN
jgi:TRAP-type C4-dicarboxylate transport system substrate-binding protein